MKSFLKSLFIFLLLPISLAVLTFLVREKITDCKLQEIANEYDNIIMGDSHMARLNPNMFDEKTINIATPGEHYFYTYFKLKKLTSSHSFKFSNVIIGVSPINFSPALQKIFDLRNIEAKTMLKKNLMFLDFNNDEYNLEKYLSLNYTYIGIFWPTEWGGFINSNNSFTDSTNIYNALDIHYNKRELHNLSVQDKYLIKIIQLCKDNSIKLYCVSTPVAYEYRKKIPVEYRLKYYSIMKRFIKDAMWVNLSESILPDSLFADADHLNEHGSKFVTPIVNKVLN